MIRNKATLQDFFLGLIFPIFNFVKALKNIDTKNLIVPMTLFYAFVGVFTLYEGTNLDTVRYAEGFEYALTSQQSFSNYFHSLSVINQIDFYTALVTWGASRVMSNTHLFLGILSGIMGLLFAININYILDKSTVNKETRLLIVLLVLVPQAVFWPHRWWTSMQFFLLGALPFVIDGSKKRLIYCVLAIFVHFSYLYAVLLLILYYFLPKKSTFIYLCLFIFTQLLSSFDFTSLSSYVEAYMPGMQAERTAMYLDWVKEESNFLSQSATILFGLMNVVMMTIVYLYTDWKRNDKLRQVFIFTLIFASFAQVLSLSPVGVRFMDFGNCIITIFYILYFSITKDSICRKIFWYCSPIVIYVIIYQIRGILDCIGLFALIFGNFVDFPFIIDKYSVLELIKRLL